MYIFLNNHTQIVNLYVLRPMQATCQPLHRLTPPDFGDTTENRSERIKFMCTAVNLRGKYRTFGRTLDLEHSYGESLTVTPRHFPLNFRHGGKTTEHEAIMGIAHISGGFPLYYDAVNESGLAVAALNFPVSARWQNIAEDKHNIASFELILWVLCQCTTVAEAEELLSSTNITADAFSPELSPTPLHWIIADSELSICAEPTKSGLTIHKNPYGVMTNEPPFPFHAAHLSEFSHLSPHPPKNEICPKLPLISYSRGTGAVGLPGDYSSPSRFVRAVFAANHTVAGNSENEAVSRFFHVMDTVSVPWGTVITDKGDNVRTVYTSCALPERGEYFFTTYENRRIRGLTLTDAMAESDSLTAVPLNGDEDMLEL